MQFSLAILGLLAGVILGYVLDGPARSERPYLPGRPIWFGVLGMFLGGTIGLSIFTVPAANVGVIYDPLRGGIQMNTTASEGFHLVSPFVKREVFSVQSQEYTMSSVKDEGAVIGDDSIYCQTNEGLGVKIDLTVLFHIDPVRAPHLWASLGEDYPLVFIRPVTREAIRMVVARHSVLEVYSGSRAGIQQDLDDLLRPTFEAYGLMLEDVKLRNVEYAGGGNNGDRFRESITAKQSAQQRVSTERRNLERSQFEKQKTINEAMGEYKAMSVRAQALKRNPALVQYEMARKLGPKTKRIYMAAPLRGGAK